MHGCRNLKEAVVAGLHGAGRSEVRGFVEGKITKAFGVVQ